MKKGFFSSRSRRLTGVDLPFLAGVLLLLGIGLATLYSAGYAKALQKTGNSYFYITRQGIFAVGGLGVMAIASWFPYKFYKKLSPVLYGVCVALSIVPAVDSSAASAVHIPVKMITTNKKCKK